MSVFRGRRSRGEAEPRGSALDLLVWSVALGGVALLPLLTVLVRALSVPVLPASLQVAEPSSVEQGIGGSSFDVSGLQEAAHTTVAANRTGFSGTLERGEWDWIAGLWVLGTAFLLLWLISGLLGIGRLRRQSSVVNDGRWLSLTHGLHRRLGLTRSVTLLRGEPDWVPMTWGVWQPVIWLPAAAEAWSSERRTVVLAHELAHIRRLDALTQWVAHIAVALHWFNPLVWMAVRRLREERERACDDMVLGLGTQPSTYAEHLLDIVRSAGGVSGPVAAMAMARRSQFEGRLLAILKGGTRRSGISRRAVAWGSGVAVLLILPLASLQPAPASAYGVQTASMSVSTSSSEAQETSALAGKPALTKAADPLPQMVSARPNRPWSTVIRLNGSHDGEPSFRLAVDAEGVILTPQRDAVVGLRPDGSLVITHEVLPGYLDPDPLRPTGSRETLVRTLRVTRGLEGQLSYTYVVNGRPEEFRQEGRAWLARILRDNHQR